jgi:hypothetical protein
MMSLIRSHGSGYRQLEFHFLQLRMSALSNAVSVLRLFSTERELSVTDVSRLLGMPKSSASRLLKAMREQGQLPHVDATPRYRVSPVFLEISRLCGRNLTLMDLADREVADICRATRPGGYMSILDGADVLILRVHLGPEPLRVVTPLGSRMPSFATSTGRALLARLDNEAVRALPRKSFSAVSQCAAGHARRLAPAIGHRLCGNERCRPDQGCACLLPLISPASGHQGGTTAARRHALRPRAPACRSAR